MKMLPVIFCIVSLLCNFAGNGHAGQKELNWIGHWKGEGGRGELLEKIKKEYIFLHPEVKLHFRYNTDLNNPGKTYKLKMANAIVKMLTTGEINWDVIHLDSIIYAMVAEKLNAPDWGREHLVDFTDIPGFAATQKHFFFSDPYYRRQTGGIIIGPYIDGFITCPWYNTNTAAKTGIKVKERGMTINDFIGYARDLSAYNQKNNTSIPFIRLSAWNRLDYLFEYLFKSQFTDPLYAIDEKYDPRKDKAFLDTLLIFEELARYQPVIDTNWRDLPWEQMKQDFLDGNGLFTIAGSFTYNQFRAAAPEKLIDTVPVEFPYVRQPNGLVADYIPTFAVMKNSPNREQAIELVMLWTEPRVAEMWVNMTKNPTGLRYHLKPAVNESQADPYSRFIFDMQKKYGTMPMRYLRSPVYVFGKDNPVSATEFHDRLADILTGRLTARSYYADVLERFQRNRQQTLRLQTISEGAALGQ